MAQVRTEPAPWIHQRCCPRCGYTGWELQQREEEAPYECPNCDEDLYARLPLTYAEREGFVALACGRHVTPARSVRRASVVVWVGRMLRRFLRRVFGRGPCG